jgi:phenylacetate-coenzyme A ligase PaaK-like adenylate-forming protein
LPLRRLSAREYVSDFVGTLLAWPVYSRREWLDRKRLDAFALRRTREMAVHAARRVPLYRDLYREAAVDPAGIRTWADVRRLPVIEKDQIRAGYPERAVAEGIGLAGCLISTSSGSTGRMMTIPHRADRLWPYLLSSQRMLKWACGGSYPFWWRQAYVYTSEYPLLRVPGFYPLTFIPTSGLPETILARLEAVRPHLLHTYPTILRDLLAAEPRRMRALGLRGVSVGSELSSQEERDGWERTLGCLVRDEYSTEELGRIASQCPAGRYHLHEDIVKLEILDEEDKPTDGIGEVVGTELHNRTMPFVRYRQGDLARISEEACDCGRHSRLLVDLVGRSNDGFLLSDGRRLPAGFLLDVAYRALIAAGEDGVLAYRFVQPDPAHAVLEVVPGPAYGPGVERGLLASLVAELATSGLRLAVVPVGAIERLPGGKRSTVVRSF